ncbi:molybdopterin molybdotransferase MoeA [Algoriphagus mannitolivorans]|uniref:molybdopterin molybdotransferase MoeA n=1 Tax=Algoriphagus mannitolivorans TaxID=226504 RepID=UPI0003FE59DC|nr:molybdopterin molybdotransferase MoeA [Algoriphagus mannitolivorans]
MNEFIPVSKAKELLKSLSLSGKSEVLPIGQALGKYTAEPVVSPMAVPSFDNSGMDGYALAWADGGESRKVVDVIQAGSNPDFMLEKGTAVRIFTGAPVPKGADTVIQQELITRAGDIISFEKEQVSQGMNVRKKGAQCKAGEMVIPTHTELSPGSIGLLASLGIEKIAVFSPPTIGIILTGDEIIDLGNGLLPGQIYNSNGPALEAYLKKLGVEKVHTYKVKDEASEVVKVIQKALAEVDILLLTGGISVGDYDFVKGGLEENGVTQLFYKVRQRPGKPLYVGYKEDQVVFALPGNPASVLSCFIQYVKPVILEWMGAPSAWQGPIFLPVSKDFEKKTGLTFFLKAKIHEGRAEILPGQESFNLLPFGIADGLVEIPQDLEGVEEGSLVAFYPW